MEIRLQKKVDSSIHSFENMYIEIKNRFLEKNYINGRNHKISHKQRSGYLLMNLHDKRLIIELSMAFPKKNFFSSKSLCKKLFFVSRELFCDFLICNDSS